MTIGSRLKKLRENNNFSQELVAEYINYTTEGYIKLEQDKEILRVDVLLELCKLYNCSEAYILHGDQEDSNKAFNESFYKTIKDKEKQKSEGYDIIWVKVMNMLSPLFNTIQSYKNIFIEFNKLNIQNALIRQKQRELIDISISIYKTERQNLKDAILTEIHYQIYLAIKQLIINTNLSITLSDCTTYSTSREIITKCKVAKYISQNLTKEFNNYITDIICNEEIETVPDYLEYRYTEENKQIIILLTIQFDKLFKQQYSNVDLLDPPEEIKDIQYTLKT